MFFKKKKATPISFIDRNTYLHENKRICTSSHSGLVAKTGAQVKS